MSAAGLRCLYIRTSFWLTYELPRPYEKDAMPEATAVKACENKEASGVYPPPGPDSRSFSFQASSRSIRCRLTSSSRSLSRRLNAGHSLKAA